MLPRSGGNTRGNTTAAHGGPRLLPAPAPAAWLVHSVPMKRQDPLWLLSWTLRLPPRTGQPRPLCLASATSGSEPTHDLIFGPVLPSRPLRKAIAAGRPPLNHPAPPPRPPRSRGARAGKGSQRPTLGVWEEKTVVLREEIQNQDGRAGLSMGHSARTRARKSATPPVQSEAAPPSPALPRGGLHAPPCLGHPLPGALRQTAEKEQPRRPLSSGQADPRPPRAPGAQRVNDTREAEIGQRGVASPHHPGQRAPREKWGHHPGRTDER